MSKIFLGTAMMSKGAPGGAEGEQQKQLQSSTQVMHALTLEELDRIAHCPEGVDNGIKMYDH